MNVSKDEIKTKYINIKHSMLTANKDKKPQQQRKLCMKRNTKKKSSIILFKSCTHWHRCFFTILLNVEKEMK